ncbi:helix-turn-helix domain-containing protein [Kribbella catacumbae]|nr:helix-turn-helix transcriptional regulator [Kribbella catacumbae]
MDFAKLLQRHRKAAHLTQQALAEKAGMSLAAVAGGASLACASPTPMRA